MSPIAVRSRAACCLALLASLALAPSPLAAAAQELGRPEGNPGPVVVVPEARRDLSPPLRSLTPKPRRARVELETELMHPFPFGEDNLPDEALQTTLPGRGGPGMPAASLQFDGMSEATSGCGCTPPDTNGEIGPHHFLQMVNTALQVFDRSGASLFGPVDINTVWSGFGGACENENAGDPVVVYDQLADRWVISQFTDGTSPYFECVAVSQSGDPTGAWHRYAFQTSTTKFNDYPKLGVWPDGYYMTANLFLPNAWAGTGIYVFEREKMLAGQAATMQFFELPPADWGGMLPSDLDGTTPPPAGAANVLVEVIDGSWDPLNWPSDELHFHQFHVDWDTPANTTFNAAPIQVPVAGFDGILCGFGGCVPQKASGTKLDTLSDRLMFRLAYRNFGTHEALVLNHTVDADSDQAAIRWYEIRDPRANPPTVHQQSTFAPDTIQRWMGSIAMDGAGNTALGYSGSSSAQTPDIRITGRLAGDALNSLTLGESILIASGSSQKLASRWGDYSDLTVDPVNDCTFWYTTEYANGSAFAWKTRIGAFTLPGCSTLFADGFEIGTSNRWSGSPP